VRPSRSRAGCSAKTIGFTAETIYNLACLAALQGKREDAFANPLHADPRFNAMLAEVKRLAAAK
jgi:hypothetical protein